MRPRWQIALLLLTLPLWFIPALLWVGWTEAGKDVLFHQLPRGLRFIWTGKDRG